MASMNITSSVRGDLDLRVTSIPPHSSDGTHYDGSITVNLEKGTSSVSISMTVEEALAVAEALGATAKRAADGRFDDRGYDILNS